MKILILSTFLAFFGNTESVVGPSNIKYDYDSCNHDTRAEHVVSGAVISANTAQAQSLPLNCTTIFKSAAKDEIFLVQVTHMNIRRRRGTCVDSLTVINYDKSNSQAYPLLEDFCGTKSDLPLKEKFYTVGRTLSVSWNHAAANKKETSRNDAGFSLTLTSVSQPPVECYQKTHLRCTNDDCMSRELLCDGVAHCRGGEDEGDCPYIDEMTSADEPVLPPPAHPLPTDPTSEINQDLYVFMPLIVVIIFTIIMLCLVFIGRKATAQQEEDIQMHSETIATNSSHGDSIMSTISLLANLTLVTATTTTESTPVPDWTTRTADRVPMATTPAVLVGWDVGSPDLISVAIVGSVFAVVLVVCIILGCREKKEPETFRNNGQLNSNPGYSDSNGPPTPPPTYSYIERQTSYVSDISQRSSQISMPPDYDDALEMPDSPSGRRRSRRRSRLSRSSTGGSSRRNRSRFPFFRSFSAQETLARYRARNSNPVELVPPARTSQLASETDTLPSLREQEADDNNTSPSDDNVFESPSNTLETRVQVEPSLVVAEVRQSPSAPGDLECSARGPENQRLLSDSSQGEQTNARVSDLTNQDAESRGPSPVTFY